MIGTRTTMSVTKLLIANRGEIAIRIARAAADMGVPTVAVHSEDDARSLHLRVADDGVGFEASADSAGNGLISMRRRAEKMGATLDVVSAPNHGTAVFLSVRSSFARRLRYPA